MICVRGNHEDHEFLDSLEDKTDEAIFPIDCYKRIYVLKTGYIHKFIGKDCEMKILGIGRVGPPAGEKDIAKSKYIQEYEKNQLKMIDDKKFDILLTHDAPRDFIRPGFGMVEISEALDKYKPYYHFFGHTGKPFEKIVDSNGITISGKMADFEWDETDKDKGLKDGCMGILRWQNPNKHTFELFKAKWLKEYTFYTWKWID